MRILRAVSGLKDGRSVLEHTTELELQSVGGIMAGVSTVTVHDDSEAGRRWSLYQIAPHTELPMHGTPTIDYMTIVDGAVDLVVEGEEPVRLHAGDCVLQGGAVHSWRTTDAGVTMSGVLFPLD